MDIVIAIIGSGALSALVSGLVSLINGRLKAKTGLDKAMRLVLLGEIERQADKYIHREYVTRRDLKRFRESYDTYKSLGGDGYADDMLELVKSLPVKEA